MSTAVIHDGVLYYIGDNDEQAMLVFRSKPGAKMLNVTSLDELESHLNADKVQAQFTAEDVENSVSDACRRILDRLDENGINAENAEEFRKKLQDGGEKLAAEVRSLGIRGLNIVGDGLATLSDFIKKAGAEDVSAQSTEEGGCCGGSESCEHKE